MPLLQTGLLPSLLASNDAILRNAARIRFPKTATVRNVRNSVKTCAKTIFELQISCSNQLSYAGAVSYESRFSELIKSSS